MSRVILCAALVTTLGCATTSITGPRATLVGARELSPDEAAHVHRAIDSGESIRGFELDEDLTVLVADAPTLEAVAADDIFPEADSYDLTLETLGLCVGTTLEEAIAAADTDVSPSDLAYSGDDGMLYISEALLRALGASDNASRVAEIKVLAAALDFLNRSSVVEDFDLEDMSLDRRLTTEALVRGDMLLTTAIAFAHATGADVDRVLQEDSLLDAFAALGMVQAADADHPLVRPVVRLHRVGLSFYGLRFVARLYREGGWEAVEAAYESLDWLSGEHILHPERFSRAHQRELVRLEVRLDSFGELRDETSFGELMLRAYFDPLGDARASRASLGWAGDVVRTYQRADGTAVSVWISTWDRIQDAVEAADAAQRIGATLPDGRATSHGVVRVQRAVLVFDGATDAERAVLTSSFREAVLGNLRPLDEWVGETD